MKLREGVIQCDFETHLGVDSMGMVTAITAPRPRAPAEKSLLPHILWVRDLLKKSILKTLSWYDTRDTTPDGLTKGSVERTALWELAGGSVTRNHAPQVMAVNAADTPFCINARE